MTISWMKDTIREGIEFLSLKDHEPYRHWHEGLFQKVPIPVLKEIVHDNHFVIAFGIPGVWDLLERLLRSSNAIRDLHPDTPNVISKAKLLSLLYASFVYPRDEIMRALTERLSHESAERRLCEAYFAHAHDQNEYWHIRNAVAHGHIDFCDEADECLFRDRSWEARISCRRLLLDSHIIQDLLISIFERRGSTDSR